MAELDIDAKRFEEASARLRQSITLQKKAPGREELMPDARVKGMELEVGNDFCQQSFP
jgi:hypothetical protein